MLEFVTMTAGGQPYGSWTEAAVSYGAKNIERAFAFTITDSPSPIAEQWNWLPGTDVQVRANGDLLCQAIIESLTPSHDSKNHSVAVSGKSKSKDSKASSPEHGSGEFRDKTALDIAKALDKQNVGFKSSAQLDKLPLHRINPGETVFSCIERACRRSEAWMMGQVDGSVEIVKAGQNRVHPPLVLGRNIEGASATFDEGDQHDEYKVKGQKVFGTDKKTMHVEQVVKNDKMKRHRPKHVLAEHDIDEKTANTRGTRQRDRQNGLSITASIRVQGWHDENGKLWVPNTLVFIHNPFLKLDMDLLLDTVHLTHGEGGSFSQLGFVQPSSMGSSAATGSKTDSIWK